MASGSNARLSRRQLLHKVVSGTVALSALASSLAGCGKGSPTIATASPTSTAIASSATATPSGADGPPSPGATRGKPTPRPSVVGSSTVRRPPPSPAPTVGVTAPATVGPTATPPPPGVVALDVDRSRPIATIQLDVGVTLTERLFDPQRDEPAIVNARRLLREANVYQNQHIMAWGASNPWPDPSVPEPTEWASLDQRIGLINETGGTPIITLAQAPWWMKGLTRQDEWRSIAYERRVRDDMLDRWILLCRRVAERYAAPPYGARYFQVWNEMKGYFNAATNTYDSGTSAGYPGEFAHGYTHMYNRVHDALKATDSGLMIGGPYVVMDSWSNRATMSHPSEVSGTYGTLDQRSLDVLATWLSETHGADFVAVAGTTTNDVPSGTGGVGSDRRGDYFAATQKFADIANWIGQRTDLPIWWSEWRAFDTQRVDQHLANAVMATSLLRMVESGARLALLWGPEGDAEGASFPLGLWNDATRPAGGQPTPYYATQLAFRQHFPTGTARYQVTTSSSQVLALASALKVLAINTAPTPVPVALGDRITALAGYEVRVFDLP